MVILSGKFPKQIMNKSLFSLNTLNLLIAETCRSNMTASNKGVLTWPQSKVNTTVALRCPYGLDAVLARNNNSLSEPMEKAIILSNTSYPHATRSCLLVNNSAVWSPVNESACGSDVSNWLFLYYYKNYLIIFITRQI